MPGPKLLLLLLTGALACACDRGPASSSSAPSTTPRSARESPTPTQAPSPAPAGTTGTTDLASLPWEERIALEQSLAASDARYAPRMDESGPVLETAGSVVATFGASGAALSFGGRATTMRVAAIGRGESLPPLARVAAPGVVGPEVRTSLGDGIVEWWRSLPSGLEHGVTIAERPAGDGDLRVEIAVTGQLSAHSLSTDAVELRGANGERVATYAHLVVRDAAGTRIPARMTAEGARLVLSIDDGIARYPLVVDPLLAPVVEALLLGADTALGDELGRSVALSADASRALVGAPSDDLGALREAGSARVFLRTGTTWTEEATLVASDAAANDQAGGSVALSADGGRALVGVPWDDTAGGADAGSARVFVRTGTSWTEEATLGASDGAARDFLGNGVALSADGSRAVVGAPGDDTAAGADAGTARVFVRTLSTWTEEATLGAAGAGAGDWLGSSVALASNGALALVGAPGDDTASGADAGSAHAFARTGASWVEDAPLFAMMAAANDEFGCSVAVAGDGTRAAVGACYDDRPVGVDAGSVRIFFKFPLGSTWFEETTISASAANGRFGSSVALSVDGSRLLVGAPSDTPGPRAGSGSARLFSRVGATWTLDALVLVPGLEAYSDFGLSVALVSDGSRALVGSGLSAGTGTGRAWVFTFRAADADGTACASPATCRSGFCVDDVCCASACGAGTPDCEACSAALTGGADGVCAALSAAAAPTVTCRAAVDVCDAPEACAPGARTCPADLVRPATDVCRPAASACDGPETCDGVGVTCDAPDRAAAPGTPCRPSAGACDVAEACDGTSFACPADGRIPLGVVCRSVAGSCDAEERCDGASAACPGDSFLSAAVVCRAVIGPCDVEDRCSGTAASCSDALAMGTTCRPATSACDVVETCDGTVVTCPTDAFVAAGTVCAPSDGALCDTPDLCTGTSADCVPTFLSGVACRPPTGACDSAEFCAGTASACPPDAVEAAGISCRASIDTRCDPEEMCDGFATACPADVTTCTPMPDAGGPTDGGASVDSSVSGSDAASPPIAAAGCGCRATLRDGRLGGLLGLLLVVAVVRRRRVGVAAVTRDRSWLWSPFRRR